MKIGLLIFYSKVQDRFINLLQKQSECVEILIHHELYKRNAAELDGVHKQTELLTVPIVQHVGKQFTKTDRNRG